MDLVWTSTPTLLNKVEACERWFLKKLFHLREHAPNHSLYIISGLLTIETLIDQGKLFFLARIITSHKIPPLINNLYRLRLLESFQALKIISQVLLKTQLIVWLNMGLSLTLSSGHKSQCFLHIPAGKELLLQSYLPLIGQGLTTWPWITQVQHIQLDFKKYCPSKILVTIFPFSKPCA